MRFKKNIAWMINEEESLLVDHQNNHGLVLNGTSNDIINFIAKGLKRDQIVEKLVNKYLNSNKLTIEEDVSCFLKKLEENGFIEEN